MPVTCVSMQPCRPALTCRTQLCSGASSRPAASSHPLACPHGSSIANAAHEAATVRRPFACRCLLTSDHGTPGHTNVGPFALVLASVQPPSQEVRRPIQASPAALMAALHTATSQFPSESTTVFSSTSMQVHLQEQSSCQGRHGRIPAAVSPRRQPPRLSPMLRSSPCELHGAARLSAAQMSHVVATMYMLISLCESSFIWGLPMRELPAAQQAELTDLVSMTSSIVGSLEA